jgi:hypothetical protein
MVPKIEIVSMLWGRRHIYKLTPPPFQLENRFGNDKILIDFPIWYLPGLIMAGKACKGHAPTAHQRYDDTRPTFRTHWVLH